MTYKECLDFLFASLPMYQRTGAAAYKHDLSTSRELDRLHNQPHRRFKSVHIAGTNGKGSVSHILSSVLQSAGYSTGLYTSPHLKDFRERIRINGKVIPESEVVRYIEENKEIIINLHSSFFEMTVDLAFMYFAKKNVDIAIIETGMGGRLDSTNIISPLVSVITNIGLDHTRFLGEKLHEIASEKAGIIKPYTPVIIGENKDETLPVFKRVAEEKKADLILADRNMICSKIRKNGNGSVSFYMQNVESGKIIRYDSDLTGHYQQKNIITALETVKTLNKQGVNISDIAVKKGLMNVKQSTGLRGRWEEIGTDPLIICDTAHNAEGIKEVVDQLKQQNYKNLHIVWGMVSDKIHQKILELLPVDASYYFTRADIPRSLNERTLSEMASEFGLKGKSYASSSGALVAAENSAGKDDVIFIGGSTFLVGELI